MLERCGLAVDAATMTCVPLVFSEWVRRSGISPADAAALRASFLGASPEARAAFQIEQVDGDVCFAWPELVILGSSHRR
jgi:hypothetical protein